MPDPEAWKSSWWGYVFETLKPYGLGTIALCVLAYWAKPHIDRLIETDLKDREVQTEVLKIQANAQETQAESSVQIQEAQEATKRAVELISETIEKQADTSEAVKNVLEKISDQQAKDSTKIEDIHKATKKP